MKAILCSALILSSLIFCSAQQQTINGLRIPGRFTFGQSESAIEMEVPTNEYNALRGYNGTQMIGTIHFFDDTWQSGAATGSAGAINLDGMNGVTIGVWNSPTAYFRKSDGYVGVGTTAPNSKFHVFGNSSAVMSKIENGNTLNSNIAAIQFKTGISASTWQTFARNGDFFFGIENSADYMMIKTGGNVGIGTSSPNQKLTVNGTIYGKEVKVDLSVPGPDYVFEKEYALPSLESIQTYINQNKHLPEVPSAKDMETNGINLSEMNMLLLKKVEELTLHLIEMNKKFNEQQSRIESQDKEIQKLKLK